MTDAGCIVYGTYQIRPSRQDTAETIKGLYVLYEAMKKACED